jgi:hypothetical protein
MATPFKPCAVDGCKNNAHWRKRGLRGWCSAHYARFLKYGTPTAGRPSSRRLSGSSCSRCETRRPRTLEWFSPGKGTSDGLSSHCKECHAKEQRERYASDPHKGREAERRSRERNPEKHRENVRRRRRLFSPEQKLCRAIRSRVSRTMGSRRDEGDRFRPKSRHDWLNEFGYTEQQLVSHVERQFCGKFDWNGYGTEWELDHIIPLAHFRYNSCAHPDFKAAWALSNLRPLASEKNRSKSGKRVQLL